jgi:hypothetical protein
MNAKAPQPRPDRKPAPPPDPPLKIKSTHCHRERDMDEDKVKIHPLVGCDVMTRAQYENLFGRYDSVSIVQPIRISIKTMRESIDPS